MINKIRKILFKTNIILGDINAISKGKFLNRIKNRIFGRLSSNATKSIWNKKFW